MKFRGGGMLNLVVSGKAFWDADNQDSVPSGLLP